MYPCKTQTYQEAKTVNNYEKAGMSSSHLSVSQQIDRLENQERQDRETNENRDIHHAHMEASLIANAISTSGDEYATKVASIARREESVSKFIICAIAPMMSQDECGRYFNFSCLKTLNNQFEHISKSL